MQNIFHKKTSLNSLTKKFLDYVKAHWIRCALCLAGVLLMTGWWFFALNKLATAKPIMYLYVACICLLITHLFIWRFPRSIDSMFSVASFWVTPMICFMIVECAMGNQINKMTRQVVWLNYLIYLFCFVILYAIFNRIWISITIGTICFTIFALLDSFILEIREYGIQTFDLNSIQAAWNVSGGYVFSLNKARTEALLIGATLILVVLHFRFSVGNGWKKRIIVIALTVIMGTCLGNLVNNKKFLENNGLKPAIWEISGSEKRKGAILNFVAGIPYMKIEKPKNYSKKAAKQALQKAAKSEASIVDSAQKKKPDIIVIMDESFSDLSIDGSFETDIDYLQNLHGLQKDKHTICGNLSVPCFGGLTSNTEFELATGFSHAYYMDKTPYQTMVTSNTENWNSSLKDQDYYSIYMHCGGGNAWNRSNVYRNFNYDKMVFEKDMKYKALERNHISDSADYKELMRQYELAKKANNHVFLFNVTIQNHGGYDTPAYEKTVHLRNMKGNYPQAEEYMSSVKKSDQALGELISCLKKKNDPVILLFFGDHQPLVETEFYEELQKKESINNFNFGIRKHQTPFLIWSNRDMKGRVLKNVSANYLPVVISELAGLELTDFQKYLVSLYKLYPVINGYGVKDAFGHWYPWEKARNFKKIKEHEFVEYYKLFDS